MNPPPPARILRSTAFLLIGALCLGGLEFYARHLFGERDPGAAIGTTRPLENSVFVHPNIFQYIDAENIEIAVFGSSFAQEGVYAELFSRGAYNFAHSSQDLYYDLELWRKYAPDMPRLKYVIITLYYFAFGYDMTLIEKDRVYSYEHIGIPPRSSTNSSAYDRSKIETRRADSLAGISGPRSARPPRWVNWLWSHSYLFKYRHLFLRQMVYAFSARHELKEAGESDLILQDDAIMGTSDRFSELDAETRIDQGKGQAQFHMLYCYDAENEAESRRFLNEMIQSVLSREIKVLVMTSPHAPEYYGALKPEFVTQFERNTQRVLAPYRGNPDVAYADFSHHSTFGLSDFRNVHHLNKWGATKLTRLLDRTLRETWE